MFSMLMFVCRDPGDTKSKVSFCVEPSSVLKILILMLLLICLWQWVWPKNVKTLNLKSASFVVIMLLHEGLTRVQSQKNALWREFCLNVHTSVSSYCSTLQLCIPPLSELLWFCSRPPSPPRISSLVWLVGSHAPEPAPLSMSPPRPLPLVLLCDAGASLGVQNIWGFSPTNSVAPVTLKKVIWLLTTDYS